jgi:hypothetical protein
MPVEGPERTSFVPPTEQDPGDEKAAEDEKKPDAFDTEIKRPSPRVVMHDGENGDRT